ncbi:ead/Ea22-like family protein [Salmonella enterica]|uniref:Ead protein n=1 Tax=Salmonella enterica subsp. enterica serovar Reading TaxID=165302 RepID=A0A644RGF7_SALET|nr:ead/Ea22-like family protein [Salmonella enterica]EAA6647925.1 ead/Ea22-like family protein [Salmonella enterica subsp. enterica serovar Reading]EDQ6417748.1 ead/Ea22-like family protein [Salmonella enterica subsp. enterica]HAT0109192.1 ead/Ea22-like family protein [Salmonella enterica subsp. enterica serovar Saintpaul]EAB8321231.1 ead/Ea22-like family protein [Salmonella enterica subsp. enterica serovar Typhimurium]EBQ9057833.1 Ead protein [Salmonella enterica subsp. enterica serovar Readi
MTALNKQALIAKIKKQTESFDTVVLKEDEANALLGELESQQTFQQAFFRQSLMYDVVAEAYEEAKEQIAKDVEIKARLCLESNSLFDRLRAAEKRIAEQSAIATAAEKLVRCKGRYHGELNYRALAKLFGVTAPDLPPLEHENVHYADAAEMEISGLRQRIVELEARKVCVPRISNDEFWLSFNNRIVFREETYRSAVIKSIEAAGIGVKGE